MPIPHSAILYTYAGHRLAAYSMPTVCCYAYTGRHSSILYITYRGPRWRSIGRRGGVQPGALYRLAPYSMPVPDIA
eukprot:2165245-Rhodomonas_salina.2